MADKKGPDMFTITGETNYELFKHMAMAFYENNARYIFAGLRLTEEPTEETVKFEAEFRRADDAE